MRIVLDEMTRDDLYDVVAKLAGGMYFWKCPRPECGEIMISRDICRYCGVTPRTPKKEEVK